MLSAADSPEVCARKKSSHLHVKASSGLAQTQDAADAASPVCHYVLHLIFLVIFPKVCRPPMRGGGGRGIGLFFLQLQKIACCAREAVAYCSGCHWNQKRNRDGTQHHFLSCVREENSYHLGKGCCYQCQKNVSYWCVHWWRKEDSCKNEKQIWIN